MLNRLNILYCVLVIGFILILSFCLIVMFKYNLGLDQLPLYLYNGLITVLAIGGVICIISSVLAIDRIKTIKLGRNNHYQ